MAEDLDLRFAMVNPLEHRAGIIELFAADGVEQFPRHFDRVFPGEVEAGLESCVAFEPGGRIVLHVARFINRFRRNGDTLTAGLTSHLIADRHYRTLKPAVLLVRHLISEERRHGLLDFLYTTTGSRIVPVLQLAGLAQKGIAARFVKLIGDSNFARRSAARLYHTFLAARVDKSIETAITPVTSLDAAVLDELLLGSHDAKHAELIPVRSRVQMTRWFPFFPREDDLIVHDVPFDTHGACLTLRLDAESHGAEITSVNVASLFSLRRLAEAAFETLRARGIWRLTLVAARESSLALAAKEAGFFERPGGATIMGTGISGAGIDALETVPHWRLCSSDFDGPAA